MRKELLRWLRCPLDLGNLSLEVDTTGEDNHIIEGRLLCIECGQSYNITDGIPHLLPTEQLQIENKNLTKLQSQTIDRFGFEWRYFMDWGWLLDYPDVPDAQLKYFGGLEQHTASAFWSKTLFTRDDLQDGHLVLDAGCGNGRFTNQAAQAGVEVIGIDLGWGTFSAFEHTRHLPNVHIVRGDLFRLPFLDQTFDRIFSIGVLQHTGNAELVFDSLARVLRNGGLILAHVYGRGLWIYEVIDAMVRIVTTRLPIKFQFIFSQWIAALTRWLQRDHKRLYAKIFQYVNLLPTDIHMFDWWAAPIATHHTQEEVQAWFAKNHLEILQTNPTLNDKDAEKARCRGHGPITVLGRSPISE